MVRAVRNSREARVKRVAKRLEGMSYIPRAAKYLSEILVVLAESSHSQRTMVLGEFGKAVNEKPTWTIAGKRA